MKLAFVGLGQAGGKIVDRFLEFDQGIESGFVETAIAVNTATLDLQGLEHVPSDNQILIGQSRVNGHGVGADNELASEIAHDNLEELLEKTDTVSTAEIDGFLLVAGLGGGTGSGAGPVLARELRRVYTEPVYGLGILPASDEGGIYTMNAARSLQTFAKETDNLLLFDNEAWRESDESVAGGFDTINEELVQRFGVLFSAGEFDPHANVAEGVVDSSEIINTLASGGVSSVGYASSALDIERDGLLSKFGEDSGPAIDSGSTENQVASLVRKAVLGRLTLPCKPHGIQRALVVVAGPPEHLSRKGMERARSWLEEETDSFEVRGGDYPIPGSEHLEVVVLLSGVKDAPRIEELKQRGVETKDRMEEQQASSDRELDELLESEDLDSLL